MRAGILSVVEILVNDSGFHPSCGIADEFDFKVV
jgi:hypothetical protein